MRRIAVHLEKRGQAIDQVIKSWREIRVAIEMPPAIQEQAIAFILLQRRGIEHAQHIVADSYRFDLVAAFSRGAPVKRIHILQNSQQVRTGNFLSRRLRKMSRSEMGFSKQHDD